MLTATFVLRLLLALTCVVGLIWYIGRRFGNGGSQHKASREPGLKVVGRQSMGKHAGVAVLAVGERRLLIGYGEAQVSMLTELGAVYEEPPAPKAAVSTDATEPTSTAWVLIGRAAKNAVGGLLPTQRRKATTPASPTPVAAPVAAPVARKELDASPLDRLDQADWPTSEYVAPSASGSASAVTVEPSAPVPSAARVEAVAPAAAALLPDLVPADVKNAALAGSILAPDTWRQAVKSLQDRTVRR
ncbi:flagellar biosynthetic protein FliO [Cellulomonas sp. URHE0023]|uniref:FliO/MopB family protein n=1 Tax=Cellulomonas sp. URHE0023 TaxID=1380354 RepID=UPI0004825E27|nr:flagellar biosynthetic protein FliO [Cellulomonas sp. URHE0023]